jgi:ketosteroid isomerase-like protein
VERARQHEIVRDAVGELRAQLRLRDLEGALALFWENAVVLGSGERESADGLDELREFFAALFTRPQTFGWSELEPLHTGGGDELIWFVAPTTVVIEDEAGNAERLPYCASGVLELAAGERWLFRLFNGSEPATA